MVPACSELESVESIDVDTSDVVGLVLMTVGVDMLVVSPGDDISWDTVCPGFESIGKAEKLDMVTSVSVVSGVLLVSVLPVWRFCEDVVSS